MHAARGEGQLVPFDRTAMRTVNGTSGNSGFPTLVRKASGHGFFHAVNQAIATVIASREQQAHLTILRELYEPRLRDAGALRDEICPGLSEAAKGHTHP
jgi:hypothetical protein